ncbi:MAG: ATP-binding protein [Candidatus Woesearchaeota archaeon]
MIQREIYPKLQKLYQKPDILALVGSRRVGKTTLMHLLFEAETRQKEFLSFDDQEVLSLFQTNIKEFANLYVQPNSVLFIDEFQYAKEGGKQLKYLYDTYDIKVVISGSSSPELTIQSLSYLVGRVFIVTIYPLTFKEFLKYKEKKYLPILKNPTKQTIPLIQSYFEEYLQFGGYPQVVLEKTTSEKIQRLKQIVNTYLLKEIRDILQYKDSVLFERFLKVLALQEGGVLNKSKLSSLLDIHIHKVTEILHVLEQTFIITQLQPYQNTKIKELIKSAKLYFQDSGFRNVLLNNFNTIHQRIDKGVIYEQFILQTLKQSEKSMKFYNYKNSSEVDFLLDDLPIEVKSHISAAKIERGFYSYLDKFNPRSAIVFNENIIEDITVNRTRVEFKHFFSVFSVIE